MYSYVYIYIYICIAVVQLRYTTEEYNSTVGFHNFNLRILNSSLKSEQISCGCFC